MTIFITTDLNLLNKVASFKKSEKKASLSISAKLNQKYWLDPSGKEFEVGDQLGHYGWIAQNLKDVYDGPDSPEQADAMIQNGWTRITTESDYDFAMEVADLNNLPSYLDNFVASHYTGGGVEIDDLTGEYQDISDPFPSIQKQINHARQMRLQPVAKAFSKRELKAHNYDILGDPSLRQGSPRAIFNFIQKGVPEMGISDVEMFDILGDHPRFGSTVSRDTLKQLNIPIVEDRMAKQAKTKKIKQGDYSCIMAMIPHGLAQEIVEFGVREIPDSDLYLDENDNLGRELQAHVTILYGLLTDDAKSVRRSFNDTKPFKVKLGKVRHFQPPERDFDVVTVEVISDDLNEANKMIVEKFDCADDLPSSDEYKSHITIAYVKRDMAKKHIGSDKFEGIEVELDTLVFSPRKGNKTYFSIGTDKESAFVLEKIEKTAEFLPSLFNAPDNHWTPESDKEIALNPDSVSDDTTEYEPCTTGKPRSKDMWRQFMSIFKNPFSKKESVTLESSIDMEPQEWDSNYGDIWQVGDKVKDKTTGQIGLIKSINGDEVELEEIDHE